MCDMYNDYISPSNFTSVIMEQSVITSPFSHITSTVASSPISDRGEYLIVQFNSLEPPLERTVPSVCSLVDVTWCTWLGVSNVGRGVGSMISSTIEMGLLIKSGRKVPIF